VLLTEEQANILARHTLKKFILGAAKKVDNSVFEHLTPEQQITLVSLFYNSPGLIGPSLKKALAEAIDAEECSMDACPHWAAAYYETRYNSSRGFNNFAYEQLKDDPAISRQQLNKLFPNDKGLRGIGNRRLAESDLFLQGCREQDRETIVQLAKNTARAKKPFDYPNLETEQAAHPSPSPRLA
jgi:GH24 family phage-related lysozyme (muramidase)